MQIHHTKAELRKVIKEKRRLIASNLSPKTAGQAIISRIIGLEEFIRAKTVIMFYPMGDEADILPLFELSRDLEKKVAFPCSLGDGKMIFRYADNLSQLITGKFNIPEPQGIKFEIPSNPDDSICIVPALAIDMNGHRIGYGGGYYDRFLAIYNGTSIGIAYDDLIIDNIIVEPFDIPVDIIITERRTICPKDLPN